MTILIILLIGVCMGLFIGATQVKIPNPPPTRKKFNRFTVRRRYKRF